MPYSRKTQNLLVDRNFPNQIGHVNWGNPFLDKAKYNFLGFHPIVYPMILGFIHPFSQGDHVPLLLALNPIRRTFLPWYIQLDQIYPNLILMILVILVIVISIHPISDRLAKSLLSSNRGRARCPHRCWRISSRWLACQNIAGKSSINRCVSKGKSLK